MTSLLTIAALGLALGMRHATDADHVLAVTTIVARRRTVAGAALVGAAWGVGHTLTVGVVGGGIILLGWVIPERVGLSMELAVGIMLIVLGAMNLSSVLDRVRQRFAVRQAGGGKHAHAHPHGDYVHTHVHGHGPGAHPHAEDDTPVARLDGAFGGRPLYRLLRPFVVGVVHGLAGSAAVALLVLATIGSPSGAMLYLGLFGAGTIVGMMLITALLAVPLVYRRPDADRLNGRLRIASGLLSLAFGCFLAYEVGWVQGLFITI